MSIDSRPAERYYRDKERRLVTEISHARHAARMGDDKGVFGQDSRHVVLENLPFKWTRADLIDFLAPVDQPEAIHIRQSSGEVDKTNFLDIKAEKGAALVVFSTPEKAENAVFKLHGSAAASRIVRARLEPEEWTSGPPKPPSSSKSPSQPKPQSLNINFSDGLESFLRFASESRQSTFQVSDVLHFFRQLLESKLATELHVAAIVAVAEVIRRVTPVVTDQVVEDDASRCSITSYRRRSASCGTGHRLSDAPKPQRDCDDCHACSCTWCSCSSLVCDPKTPQPRKRLCPACYDWACANVHCEYCPSYEACCGPCLSVDTQRSAMFVMFALHVTLKTLKGHLLNPGVLDDVRRHVSCRVLTALPCFSALDLYFEHVRKMYRSFTKTEFGGDFRCTVIETATSFCHNIRHANSKVAHQAALFVAPQCRRRAFVTHAWSETAATVFEACAVASRHEPWTLFVCTLEMHPDEVKQLEKQVVALNRSGREVRLVTDAEVVSVLERVDAVVLGAEIVTWEGGLINRLGARNLCLAAHAAQVPVFIAVPSFKFFRIQLQGVEQFYQDSMNGWHSEAFGGKERYAAAAESLAKARPVWQTSQDASLARNISPALVDLLITDLGVLTPAGVVDEMYRFLFGEAGVDGAGQERDWRQAQYGWEQ